MSLIARWSYKNTATIKPYLDEDLEEGGTAYGPEYTIACTWAAGAKQMRDENGAEFVSNYIIWSEDPRPRYRDLILLNTVNDSGWQEIRQHMAWDMAMFDDVPDYRTVT